MDFFFFFPLLLLYILKSSQLSSARWMSEISEMRGRGTFESLCRPAAHSAHF